MKLSEATVIGITGRAGAGKNTTFERIQELGGPRFVQRSFAAPLKASLAALLGVTVQHLEHMKRDPQASLHVRASVDELGVQKQLGTDLYRVVGFSMRQTMQRYGTEAHRDIFGGDFWVDAAANQLRDDGLLVEPWSSKRRPSTPIPVFTDLRFDNEAEWVRDLGGTVLRVVGPPAVEGTLDGHASENGIDDSLVDEEIDNSVRQLQTVIGEMDWSPVAASDPVPVSHEPCYQHLDDQIATLLHGGTLR